MFGSEIRPQIDPVIILVSLERQQYRHMMVYKREMNHSHRLRQIMSVNSDSFETAGVESGVLTEQTSRSRILHKCFILVLLLLG